MNKDHVIEVNNDDNILILEVAYDHPQFCPKVSESAREAFIEANKKRVVRLYPES